MQSASERRDAVLAALEQEQEPVSATNLAHRFGVSRQIIVGDVALLRASGAAIEATPRGYVLTRPVTPEGLRRQVVCNHAAEDMVEELNICVDHGCTVLDVMVDHPIYGQLSGKLCLASRYDVQQFALRLEQESAHSLSELTDGVHLHTLLCPDESAYMRVCEDLRRHGLLYENTD